METKKKLEVETETKHKKKKVKKYFKEIGELTTTETEKKILEVTEKFVLALTAIMQYEKVRRKEAESMLKKFIATTVPIFK